MVKMLLNIKLVNFIFSNILTINIEFRKLQVFNVNNGIPLEKLVDCTLTTMFLVGMMMAG